MLLKKLLTDTKAKVNRLLVSKYKVLKTFKFTILLFCCLFTTFGFSQKKDKLEIIYSGKSYKDKTTEEGAFTFLRDNQQQVHFVHNGVNLYCDKAVWYKNQDFIEAFSNVRMVQGDTITMTAKYVEYSGKTELAFARGEVVLKEPSSTLTTNKLYFDRTKQQAYYDTSGKVVRDSSGTITSKIGRYYMTPKKYQFIDSVVLVNPEYTLKTKRLDFFNDSGHAYIFGPSTITGEDNNIYCERGFYDTQEDFGYFERNAKIDYDDREIKGDSMYFDRKLNFASATNNIKVTDTINNSIVKGNYAEVWKAKDSLFITGRALAITLQEKDSIYMHSDTLMLTGPEEHRITRAYYNAKIYKSDLAGKADSIHVDHKTGLTEMINLSRFSSKDPFATKRKPVLWNIDNQMSGDTIHLISDVKTEKLDSLKVFYNAFLVSKDTISTDGFNQTKGKELIGLFKDNELYNVDIIKNAEVIYYSRNEEGELIGINKSKSGSINIKISDNNVDEIRLINKVDGDLSPESLFPKNANRLRGFDWRGDERPNSIEDLFKDDPPLKLKRIKGLDDYIPPEDFFDEGIRERVEAAKPKDSTKENKAARNIPEKKPTEKKEAKKASGN
ncbi:OstA-like protein [Winogradskyella wandonensis]|uniref:OstA-like protein n=1 Tax=Winogradskyella wandonensis TaxID=1442586 RepID=A0A4R1KQI1_9FLAO|nr:OstA-like protein [Winogradskyella wandonensis]